MNYIYPDPFRLQMKRSVLQFYPIKVWFLTVLTAPLFMILLLFIRDGLDSDANNNVLSWADISGLLVLCFLMFGIGLVLAVPTMLLSWFLYKDLERTDFSVIKRKMIFALAGIIFICLTFFFVNRDKFYNGSFEMFSFLTSYIIPFLFYSFLLKLPINEFSPIQTKNTQP